MAEKLVQGIVLKSFDFQDYDKVVTIYSDKYGKMCFVALGVNRPHSKNMYSLNTFSLSNFELFKSRSKFSLSKLKTGNLVDGNLGLTKIYNNYLFASLITSIILQDEQFTSKNYKLFKMLEISISNFSKNKNPFSTLVWFMFYVLKFLGGEWNLDICYRCNTKSRLYRKFDFNDYGLVCHNCFNPLVEERQNHEFIEYLMKVSKNNFHSVFQEPINVSYEIILSKLLFMYLKDELGIISKPIDEILSKEIYKDEEFKQYTYNVLTK